ncbi:DNA cytosine methyltransferase [Sphaerisporangium fuscum]|uniref:DNA cytosine methyltransferase n=1 Tax=Sphaerisporangium fuscum TaxID=2835868 RepID=UPI001BDCEB61|nr:DNA (cytosine-5-)-methyltransferase [Sphaerisporangium fuscum]
MTAGSMCSGYGGLDLAVSEVLGTRLLWVADNDPNAALCLAHRFPDAPNLGDIRAVDWARVPAPDVVAAGFPCQPVSSAGLGLGLDDERWLLDDIADAVGRMEPRPRLLVLENVDGLLSANRGHAMARVVSRLAALGYMGRYRVLRASDVGAPHQRARIFILAWPATDPAHLRHQRHRHPGQRRPGPAHGGQPAPHPQSDGRHPWRPQPARQLRRPDPAVTDGPAVEWGRYEAAIRRWEHLTGRPAPCPTEPAPRGGRRLAPPFSEWLMGLSAGWVTAVPDISRNGQLHLIGNGVVPQQAIAALLDLLPDHLALDRKEAA